MQDGMRNLKTICLDASLVLDWLLPTPMTDAVDIIWAQWAEHEMELVGPPLLLAETTSGLRLWTHLGRITPTDGKAAFERFCQMDLHTVTYQDLHVRAWQLATEFRQPRAYDAQYLAVAEREGCEFWTTDRPLYNSVHDALPWARLVAS